MSVQVDGGGGGGGGNCEDGSNGGGGIGEGGGDSEHLSVVLTFTRRPPLTPSFLSCRTYLRIRRLVTNWGSKWAGQYAIRNTQYATRNTQHAIRNTHRGSKWAGCENCSHTHETSPQSTDDQPSHAKPIHQRTRKKARHFTSAHAQSRHDPGPPRLPSTLQRHNGDISNPLTPVLAMPIITPATALAAHCQGARSNIGASSFVFLHLGE